MRVGFFLADSFSEHEVREDKAIALDPFSCRNRDRLPKHRTRGDYRMKLAILAAGIDVRWEIAQQIGIEATPGEAAVEVAWVDTDQMRHKPACNHLMSE